MESERLEKLYKKVDQCKFCKAEGNNLQHIHGFGAMNPRLMLILVNPTYRNLSSAPKYEGPKFPFIGVRQFWRVLADGGLINRAIAYRLPLRSGWETEHTMEVQKELIRNGLFLTNMVKCCYNNSAYPDNRVIDEQLKLLAEEIKILNPKRIVAFGGLVYKALTGKNVKLSECWGSKQSEEIEKISGLGIRVAPCYFPIGRGRPKEAAEILRKFV